MKNKVLIYGAYGFTGRLITKELQKKGISPVLSGRSPDKLERLSSETGLPIVVGSLEDLAEMPDVFSDVGTVIHCAGPFKYTAEQMVKLCVLHKCHYLDITGEFQVFEYLQNFDDKAKDAGIMILPGAGFDVVPSDCLAAKLHSMLPEAKELLLAFTSKGGGISRGTAKTMIEGISDGLVIRSNGKLKSVALGSRVKKIDFGEFEQLSAGISWGDVSTAFFSTGIPNIEVYTGTTEKQVKSMKWGGRLKFLLGLKWVRNFLFSRIDKRPPGPGEERRKTARSYLYGKAWNKDKSVEVRLKTADGYTLTARSVTLICHNILQGNFKSGYQTPSTAYGTDFVLNIEGSEGWK